MVTGSGFGESSVPQNLGTGQNECLDRNILGPGQDQRNPEKTIGKLAYHVRRTLVITMKPHSGDAMMGQNLCSLEACDPHVPVGLWADQGIDLVDSPNQPARGG
jgi:hypothetical protein